METRAEQGRRDRSIAAARTHSISVCRKQRAIRTAEREERSDAGSTTGATDRRRRRDGAVWAVESEATGATIGMSWEPVV